jgi:hypothetical protein
MIENNQPIQPKSKGGARPGAGRKKSSLTVKTRDIAEEIAKSGVTPLEYLMSVVQDEASERKERMSAAMAAAPYMHPKLASIEHTGEGGGPINHNLEVVFRSAN